MPREPLPDGYEALYQAQEAQRRAQKPAKVIPVAVKKCEEMTVLVGEKGKRRSVIVKRPQIVARDPSTREICVSDLTAQELAEVRAITTDYDDVYQEVRTNEINAQDESDV